MRSAMDFGAWWTYVYRSPRRLSSCARSSARGPRRLDLRQQGARSEFAEFYAAEASAVRERGPAERPSTAQLYGLSLHRPGEIHGPRRHQARTSTTSSRGARAPTWPRTSFMPAVSPATLQIQPNAHYKNAEDYTWALAEAIREEYKAIVDAGLHPADRRSGAGRHLRLVVLDERRHRGLSKWARVPGRGAQPRAARASRKIAFASTSAGAAGTARTRPTSAQGRRRPAA